MSIKQKRLKMAANVGEFLVLSELINDTETDEENDDTFVIVCTVAALMFEFIMVSIKLYYYFNIFRLNWLSL